MVAVHEIITCSFAVIYVFVCRCDLWREYTSQLPPDARSKPRTSSQLQPVSQAIAPELLSAAASATEGDAAAIAAADVMRFLPLLTTMRDRNAHPPAKKIVSALDEKSFTNEDEGHDRADADLDMSEGQSHSTDSSPPLPPQRSGRSRASFDSTASDRSPSPMKRTLGRLTRSRSRSHGRSKPVVRPGRRHSTLT